MSALLGWALEYLAEAIFGRRLVVAFAVLVVLASAAKTPKQAPATRAQERSVLPW